MEKINYPKVEFFISQDMSVEGVYIYHFRRKINDRVDTILTKVLNDREKFDKHLESYVKFFGAKIITEK